MRETLVILIGNSDDKLSQSEWARYINDVQALVDNWGGQTHFAGFSDPRAPWQNAAWVVEWDVADFPILNEELSDLARTYEQDSIAVITGGTTRFVTP